MTPPLRTRSRIVAPTYHEYASYTGDTRVPGTKILETESCLVEFSEFTIFQFLGMVKWQNAKSEKQKHGKTINTITAKISPERTTELVKMQIEAKTGIPADNYQLVARGRVFMDNMPLKEYGLSGEETIDMTSKLMGGMKHKSLSPKPMDTEREKKKERI